MNGSDDWVVVVRSLSHSYGSAVALVILLICLAFSIVYLRLARQPDYLGGM